VQYYLLVVCTFYYKKGKNLYASVKKKNRKYLQIQISIWNLEEQTVSYIQNVKSSSFDKLHFNPNGERLAVIVTEEGQDTVEIYKTENWKISRVSTADLHRFNQYMDHF